LFNYPFTLANIELFHYRNRKQAGADMMKGGHDYKKIAEVMKEVLASNSGRISYHDKRSTWALVAEQLGWAPKKENRKSLYQMWQQNRGNVVISSFHLCVQEIG
jgi:hypothetical protein